MSSPKESSATGLSSSFRSTPVHSLHLHSQGGRFFPRAAPAASPLRDKMFFQEVPKFTHQNQKLIDKPEMSKIISELRAGDLPELIIDLIITVLFLGVVFTADGFHMPANRGVIHPNGGVIRPANGGIQDQINNPPKQSAGRFRMSDSQEMCPAQPDKNGFVMSYEDAYDLVAQTYSGYIDVNDRCKISDWQSAKHIYHCKGMGIDPAEYGFTQADLGRIAGEDQYEGGGLIAYARRGHRLPPIEMIREYSEKLKEGCDNAASRKTNVDFYDINGKWKSTVFSTPPLEGKKSGIMIVFNESTGDLITGDRQRPKAFTKLEEEGYIGSTKLMTKWNNSSNIPDPMPASEFSSLAENQNTGFTPINSFKSDVTGITPSNHSSSDS